ncbi:hypothetical protein EMGR_003923, partial [Emarellia grisea]
QAPLLRSGSNPSIQSGYDIDDDDEPVATPSEVSRRPVMATGPKIPMPVVAARPQPAPVPAKPLTEFDLNLARILREVAEAKRGG